MIIFDLDGTLADCEHRRHFVKEPPIWERNEGEFDPMSFNVNSDKWRKWKPDWRSFYESCSEDKPILPVIHILQKLSQSLHIEIWSGRCESVREKTEDWLNKYTNPFYKFDAIKMRSIGDSTPDDKLKEQWLDEAIAVGKTIDFVFDDRPKVVRMWRKRGIFVFNCAQNDLEF